MRDKSMLAYMRISVISAIIAIMFQYPVFCGWLMLNAVLIVMTEIFFKYWVDPVIWTIISLPVTIFTLYLVLMWKIKNPESTFGIKNAKKLGDLFKK